MSSKIRLLTVEHIPYPTAAQLSISLIKIVNIYDIESFIVQVIFIDMDFEKVLYDLEMVQVNTTGDKKHVDNIEYGIIVVKERAISVIMNIPFYHFKNK